MSTVAEQDLRMVFAGPTADFLIDPTEQIDLEGAIRSGKTTVALWKVLASCTKHPGIHWLICRYSEGDTDSKLRPVFERMCVEAGVPFTWNAKPRYYELANGSWVYAFGLKAQSLPERYAKFRGVTLASVYNDQTEELPYDIYQELVGRLSQRGFPQQIILTPNPMEEDSWLADEFPEENYIRHRKYYRVSLYDNAHNLDRATVERLERVYPPAHVKHRPMLLGMRGLNVIGEPVYGALNPHQPDSAAFQRARHERALTLDPDLPLCESIDFGKKHPCVIWAQYTPWAELRVLGGVMGMDMFLGDFIRVFQQYRARWFPKYLELASCCDPAGSHDNSQGTPENGVSILKAANILVTYKDDSNVLPVRLAMVDRIASYMRARSPRGEESFAIDNERWVRVSSKSVTPHRFVADGFEAGYVWDSVKVSHAGKSMRRPKKDGWYEHGQNCLEYLEHNFGGIQPTIEQAARHATAVKRPKPETDNPERDIVNYMRRGGYQLTTPPRRGFGRRGGL